ncbi:MAG: hypothetical protein ACOC6J_12095, partial [Spirochaetota bacterium]
MEATLYIGPAHLVAFSCAPPVIRWRARRCTGARGECTVKETPMIEQLLSDAPTAVRIIADGRTHDA